MHDLPVEQAFIPILPRYATRKEIACMLAVCPATIARLEKEGCFKSYRIARGIRYNIEEIETFVKAQTLYFQPLQAHR